MDELLEYGIYLALLVALAIPLSGYINKVMAGERVAVLSRVLVPVENVVYRCIRVDRADVMGWKRYLISALVFSALSLAGLFAILMLQGVLPGNPEGLPGLTWDLAFNTAASFVTNTNWQAYSGESALSYFSQAIGLTVQNFVTPAVGMAVLFALFRGLVSEGGPGLGNFFVDATRAVLFVLIPLALVVTVVDVWQGSPQNVSEYQEVQLLEPVGIDSEGEVVEADDPAAVQVIDEGVVPMGPQASQVAIKQLGTNGGGYNGVNSASALENPTPLTNLVQCISLLLIPFALVFSFGRFVADRRQGRAIFAAMFIAVSYTHLDVYKRQQVGRPRVLIKKDEQGRKLEPIEEATVDVPSEYAGKAIEVFGSAGGEMADMFQRGDQTHLVFKIPTRGTMGLRTRLLNVTRGEATMFHHFSEYGAYRGDFNGRKNGSMISMSTEKSVAYALDTLQERGKLFVGPGEDCYEGMIVGESAKEGDMVVNIAKSKQLGNQRSSGADKAIQLTPPQTFTLEEALEYIEDDELVEVTPKSIRLRKRILSSIERKKANKN